MSKKAHYTPREAAHDVAIEALRRAYLDADVATQYARTPAQIREFRVSVAKLHDRLLEASGMDGMALGD